MAKKFYLTTTLPYVNSDPHIGFALEIIQADAIARYKTIKGYDVFFNTGTDEHGAKIYEKALEQGLDPQEFCDKYAAKFKQLKEVLNLSFNNFIRTTDEHHIKAAQEFWKRCDANGDIYKKNYKAKYCIGCELEKTDSELVNGKCPIHPNLELQIIEEENYFFRFSKYQKPLLDFYKTRLDFVIPEKRYNEIIKFVEDGLIDFSISRLKEKMPWGIPVPGDREQVFFVWFDALINYISALDWPENEAKFKEFWPGMQVAGKDNLRQQSAMWQAMLMSAGLPNSSQIFIHGFITADGQKMSKSLGNVIDPIKLVEKYMVDPVRYFLLREFSPFEDGDFTYEHFQERYEADLAKGLGNLVSRVLTLAEKAFPEEVVYEASPEFEKLFKEIEKEFEVRMEEFKFNEALAVIWKLISHSDEYIDKKKPWEKENKAVLKNLLASLFQIAQLLRPFLPDTADKIFAQLGVKPGEKSESSLTRPKPSLTRPKPRLTRPKKLKIKKAGAMFPRLS